MELSDPEGGETLKEHGVCQHYAIFQCVHLQTKLDIQLKGWSSVNTVSKTTISSFPSASIHKSERGALYSRLPAHLEYPIPFRQLLLPTPLFQLLICSSPLLVFLQPHCMELWIILHVTTYLPCTQPEKEVFRKLDLDEANLTICVLLVVLEVLQFGKLDQKLCLFGNHAGIGGKNTCFEGVHV